MIRLNKQAQPDVLARNAAGWTKQALEGFNGNGKIPEGISKQYRHPTIKVAVSQDSNGKCMYCEAKVTHISFGDVEHIKPKSKYPDEMFDWNNLGFVCSVCNNKKRDIYYDQTPFINPYAEDPNVSLKAIGAYIHYLPGNARGEITVKTLELNRAELLEDRLHALESIKMLLDRYANETNPTLKGILKDTIMQQTAGNQEYSMCLKEFVSVLDINLA